jgi:alpha-D-ribose 1-methylphosphonate 5-triphosphate synthase subunit PhnH
MQSMSSQTQLGKGFDDPVLASQRCFRLILAAMSEPGSVHRLDESIEAPTGVSPAATLVLLTLVDHETPVWLASSFASAATYLRFHCGAPLVEAPSAATFALVDGASAVLDLGAFNPGDDRYPDRSATLVVGCAAFEGGPGVSFSGPGIRGARAVSPSGLAHGFWPKVAANNERYPLGVDLILAARDEIMCIPRSTRIALGSEAH